MMQGYRESEPAGDHSLLGFVPSDGPVTAEKMNPFVLPDFGSDWAYPCEVAAEWLRHPWLDGDNLSELAESGVPPHVLKAGLVRKALVEFDGSGGSTFNDSDGELAWLFAMRRGDDWPADILAVTYEPSERFGLWLGLEPIIGEPFGWQVMGGSTKVYPHAWDWLRGGCDGIVLAHKQRAIRVFKQLERIEAMGGKAWASELGRLHAVVPGYCAPTITYDGAANE